MTDKIRGNRFPDPPLEIKIKSSHRFNYALFHKGTSFIEEIVLKNTLNKSTGPLKIRIKMKGFLDQTLPIKSIPAKKSMIINNPFLEIDPEPLENQNCSRQLWLEISLNETLIHKKNIQILSYNEWSLENNPHHRISLASFVIPHHPYVEQLTAELGQQTYQNGKHENNPRQWLEWLYHIFLKQWKIQYVHELLSLKKQSQRIRLPHQVLIDWNNRTGIGTCIDLSLLFAACLENLRLQPLIIMVEIKAGLWHAFIGCWQENHFVHEPIIMNKSIIKKQALMVDPTGFTENRVFSKAQADALSMIDHRFLFAIDVSACREYKIDPLPFSGHPQRSEIIIHIDQRAKKIAERIGRETGYKAYTPIHALIALLELKRGFGRELFKKAGIDITESIEKLKKGLKNVSHPYMDKALPSSHYNDLFDGAEKQAKKEGSPLVMEKHLVTSLLNIFSQGLEHSLKAIGTSREALKKIALTMMDTFYFINLDEVKTRFGPVE